MSKGQRIFLVALVSLAIGALVARAMYEFLKR
jgi:hypothetical protein